VNNGHSRTERTPSTDDAVIAAVNRVPWISSVRSGGSGGTEQYHENTVGIADDPVGIQTIRLPNTSMERVNCGSQFGVLVVYYYYYYYYSYSLLYSSLAGS